jgi:hypothetical protein
MMGLLVSTFQTGYILKYALLLNKFISQHWVESPEAEIFSTPQGNRSHTKPDEGSPVYYVHMSAITERRGRAREGTW